jgi:hypothetical protein
MIIVDTSQFAIGAVMSVVKSNKTLDENLVRHFFLNKIRENRVKFHREYGELVFAIDSKNTWRKDSFEYYKANRKKSRSDSDIDWGAVYEILDRLIVDLNTVFPYKVVKVPKTEGDDIIATLCIEYPDEKKLILSSDKDFIQLQKFPNVFQYDAVRSRWLKDKNPDMFLREHIIRGDDGDGIPNFLSPDNVFVSDGRQKSITQKKLDVWLSMSEDEFCRNLTEDQKSNWSRNRMLIDLPQIPAGIKTDILDEFKKPAGGHRSKILTYFIKHRMKLMTNCLSDF